MYFSYPISIRFADIDAFNHVNNAKYLTYFEHARMNFFDKVLPEINWKEQGMILARTEVNFVAPVFLHDTIEVQIQCIRFGKKSFDMAYKIVKLINNEKVEAANGISVLVAYDYTKNSTIPLPEKWVEKMRPYFSA
jgi:acyl-CoA thioester hydrolase